jgi:hypothetical protein
MYAIKFTFFDVTGEERALSTWLSRTLLCSSTVSGLTCDFRAYPWIRVMLNYLSMPTYLRDFLVLAALFFTIPKFNQLVVNKLLLRTRELSEPSRQQTRIQISWLASRCMTDIIILVSMVGTC